MLLGFCLFVRLFRFRCYVLLACVVVDCLSVLLYVCLLCVVWPFSFCAWLCLFVCSCSVCFVCFVCVLFAVFVSLLF